MASISDEPLLKHFEFAHLRPGLKDVSRPFAEHAHRVVEQYPHASVERTTTLLRLCEAKDWAVRTHIEARGVT